MIRFLVVIIVLIQFGLAGPLHAFDGPARLPELIAVDHADRSITFAGIVTAEKWDSQPRGAATRNKNADPDHWHLVISSTQANLSVGRIPLLTAWVADEDVASGLAEIGAVGKSFNKKSFTHRMDQTSPYPDTRPEGTKVSIYVSWKNFFGITRTVEADDFLTNSSGKKLDLVYLGNQHSSDCIVCLYGCIGSVCANRALTVRDYFDRGVTWSLKKGVLPDDGTQIWITIKITPDNS